MVSYTKFTHSLVIGAIALTFGGCPGCNNDKDKKDKDAPGGENDWKEMKAPAKKCIDVFPENHAGVTEKKATADTLKAVKEECTKLNKAGEGKGIGSYANYCVGIQFTSTEDKKKDDAKGEGVLLVTAAKYEKEPKDSGSDKFATDKEPNNQCLTSVSGLKFAKDGQEKKEEKKEKKSFAQTNVKRGQQHLRN